MISASRSRFRPGSGLSAKVSCGHCGHSSRNSAHCAARVPRVESAPGDSPASDEKLTANPELGPLRQAAAEAVERLKDAHDNSG